MNGKYSRIESIDILFEMMNKLNSTSPLSFVNEESF